MFLRRSILFLQCVIFHFTSAKQNFITPNQTGNIESFTKGTDEYLLINWKVTWEEAKIICESYPNGSLAIVNNSTANFLAEALSESTMKTENSWVGARRFPTSNDTFRWIDSGDVFPDKYLIKRESGDLGITRDCLSFNRKFHLRPNFIDMNCALKRPFICQKVYEKKGDDQLTTLNWIVIGKYSFGIFYEQITWKQAVHACRKRHKAHLASFTNIDEVQIMGKYELIGRPSLENAWIGGYYKHGNWRFIFDHNIIPMETGNNLFPPWRTNIAQRKRNGCLLLDRHLYPENTVFLEARCERKRSYICRKDVMENQPPYDVIILNNHGYLLFLEKHTWPEALEMCKSLAAKLIKIDSSNLQDVLYIMSEKTSEIKHIWIGGKLNPEDSKFYWVDDNTEVITNNVSYYPPWYENTHDQQYSCLNMDRENHNIALLYGTRCSAKQRFVCQLDDITNIPQIDNSSAEEVDPSRSLF